MNNNSDSEEQQNHESLEENVVEEQQQERNRVPVQLPSNNQYAGKHETISSFHSRNIAIKIQRKNHPEFCHQIGKQHHYL